MGKCVNKRTRRATGKLVFPFLVNVDAIATSCPLCQLNLEMRQYHKTIPVFYFTELIGLAFGLDGAHSWWGKHLIDPTVTLQAVGHGKN